MAACGHLVLPIQGLLLCALALHLCAQAPRAAAESDAAYNSSVASNSSVSSNASTASNSSSASNSSAGPDSWENGIEETPLTCQGFQCAGERCYEDRAYANATLSCPAGSYCELYRFSSGNYTARCSSNCSAELCRANGSVSVEPCALDCCDSPLCLQLNATSYGDLVPTTTPATTTTTTTSTTRAPAQNGKLCASFSCHGEGCFKGKKAVAGCTVGHDFCEMKKTGVGYVAGCSRACKTAKPVCASGTKAPCYQECCPATPRASCLKLDGKVHASGVRTAPLAPLLQLLACGTAVLLGARGFPSLWQ